MARADYVVNGGREDVVKRMRELTGGLGCDIVVETANHPSTAGQAIDLASAYGRVMLFGLYPKATISPLTLMRSGLSVMGDVATTPRGYKRAIRWVQYKKVSAQPLITRKFGLDMARRPSRLFLKARA